MASQLAGKSIAMFGYDQREIALAVRLLELGCDLRLVGFPKKDSLKKATHSKNPIEAVFGVQAVIAPMGNADAIPLIEIIPRVAKNTPLLIGVAKPLIKGLAIQSGLRLVEMAKIDEIAILNSIPTAEGALALAMENSDFTIHNSRALVLGLGRCGTTLSQKLVALGANVTVGSRSAADLARADALHCQTLPLANLEQQTDFDLIFNTIPALVLTHSYLRLLAQETLIIDIASQPGGTDFSAAKQLGIRAIHALSLPGRVAPKTAGEILIHTIPHLLEKMLGEEEDESIR